MLQPPHRPRCLEVRISWPTLFKIGIFVALAFAAVKLMPLFGLMLLALLIAITVWPVADFVMRKGGPKWLGVAACALLLFGSFGLFMIVASPVAAAQVASLIKALPTMKDHVLQSLPGEGPVFDVATHLLQSPSFSNPEPLMKQFLAGALMAATHLLQLFVVLIVAVYLVADGRRVYEWLVAFLPERQRHRVAEAAPEIFTVIFSYMGGQVITSLLCAGFIWGLLSLLHVPNALLLAIIGGVLDVLPIVGFFLALAPALAIAFTVSPFTAGCVAVCYSIYHLVESYIIVPRVYGNRLRLSTLTVLISCLAAGILGGVVEVIIILPIVASFPVIERIWLRPVLGKETVDRHDEIEKQEHPVS